MPTEPEWSKALTNSSVCNWFFILATIDAILGVAVVLLGLNLVLKSKINTLNAIMLTLGAAGAFANSWFLFLICNRSLNDEGFLSPNITKGHVTRWVDDSVAKGGQDNAQHGWKLATS